MNQFPTESDLATSADVAELGTRFDSLEGRVDPIDARFDRLDNHMDRFDEKLDGFHQTLRVQTRTYVLTMTGVTALFAALVVVTAALS